MFRVAIPRAVAKQMDRLPSQVRRRVTDALAVLRNDPRPPGCAKLAGADNLWRIRVGQYRVVYAIRESQLLVLVVRVAHRRDVYRGL